MDKLRGKLSVKPSNKSDFVFQALEWIAEDIEDEEDDGSDDGEYRVSDGIYVVRVFGMTENSESVAVKINNYTPYFYVRVPYEVQDKFLNKHLKILVFEMKEKVYKRFKESLVHSEIIMRKEFYGFTNEEKIKFLRFRFQSLSALRAYAKIFQEKIKIGFIHSKELYYQLYESNIDPILRLCHIRNVKPVGWVKLPSGKFTVVNKHSKETTCNFEFICDWNIIEPAINPNIGPIIIASFDIETTSTDGSFPNPEREGDKIIQIGTTCHYHGQKDVFLKHIITLGACNPIEGVEVESYETEEEVLLAWKRFITLLDPDIITGYNIWGFDLQYLYKRSVLLGITDEFSQLGRIIGRVGQLEEKQLQSSALGQNFFYILEMKGRVQVDIMKVVQRDYKLDMYKLDFVAETFLKMNKVDLSPKQLFAKFREGGSENIKEIAVYCVQDCELCNKLMNKLEIVTNNVGMGNVCHVPFYWLFLRGQGVKIYSLVARQCRLEEFLLKLQRKGSDEDKGYEGAVVLVATPGIYMVPISVNDFASLYPSSMISENISHDSIVFYKVMDNDGNVINMQGEKPGWFSLPRYREYEKDGILDNEMKKLGYKTNYIESVNYEGYYGDLTRKAEDDDYVAECNETESGKKILGKTICCFVEKDLPDGREEKSVIPRILENLLWERRVTRASAFYEEFIMKDGSIVDGNLAGPKEDDEFYYVAEYKQKPKKVLKADVVERREKYNKFQQSVLDGLQLAFKVTANSLYGQVGAPTSPIYFKELASCTTATGRKMLKTAKEMTESHFPHARCVYGDSVTGDTPLILRDSSGNVVIKTIESLSDEWTEYEEFKAGESNRREKQQAICDLEIWVTDHWAKINRVIRHKTKKRIFRINTHIGCVDVTEDHSLLNELGEIIKPSQCEQGKTQLLHGFPSEFCGNNLTKTGKISNVILNNKFEDRLLFVNHYFVKDQGRYIVTTQDKLIAQQFYYLLKSVGCEATVDAIGNYYVIEKLKKLPENCQIIRRKYDLGYCSEDDFVYDIETSSGRFNGGIGQITLKNTDSCFFDFSQHWEKVLGLKLEGIAALEKSIELCQKAGKIVTSALKKPHDLEYEKTFFPFVQLAKKRYVGLLYEDDPHAKPKMKSMGIVLKRRDNAPIVKTIYGGIVDKILYDRDIQASVRFFRESVRDLLAGKANLNELVITKTLRAEYKNPDSIAHKVLADRMTARDPGNKPSSNDRIPFIYIQTKAVKGEKLLQGDKVEHPDYIRANPDKCKPDYIYYLEHQIQVPCIQLLALALEQISGYRDGWMDNSILNRMRERGKSETDIQDKIMELKEREAEKLLLGDILRTYQNRQSGNSMLTDYFTRKPGPAPIDKELDELIPKTKTIGIEKIKEIVETKKTETVRLEEKILEPPKDVILRMAKTRTRKTVEKVVEEKPVKKSVEVIEETKELKAITKKASRNEKVAMVVKSSK